MIPDGSLRSLPFHLLVAMKGPEDLNLYLTESEKALIASSEKRGFSVDTGAKEKSDPSLNDPWNYDAVDWLARKYAISTLPSISSLPAVRKYKSLSLADKPFIGFGDPILGNSVELTMNVDLRKLCICEIIRLLTKLAIC